MRIGEIAANEWMAKFQGSPLLVIPPSDLEGYCDLMLAEDLYLDGGNLMAWGAKPGDSVTLQVIDNTLAPILEWVTKIQPPTVDGSALHLEVSYRGLVPAGCGLRMKAEVLGGYEVKFRANYFLHKLI